MDAYIDWGLGHVFLVQLKLTIQGPELTPNLSDQPGCRPPMRL